jgi:hypothetical protein
MIIVVDNLNDPQHRSSADGLTTNNQTNLAIKGIIAIKAMSKMSSVVHQTADAGKYNVCADVLNRCREIDSFIEYSREPLWSMEKPGTGR